MHMDLEDLPYTTKKTPSKASILERLVSGIADIGGKLVVCGIFMVPGILILQHFGPNAVAGLPLFFGGMLWKWYCDR